MLRWQRRPLSLPALTALGAGDEDTRGGSKFGRALTVALKVRSFEVHQLGSHGTEPTCSRRPQLDSSARRTAVNPVDRASDPHYRQRVANKGGLKLRLESATARDRRIRFAQVTVSGSADEPKTLFTDADGCIDHRLDDGDYTLSVSGGPRSEFQVRDHRWTVLRLRVM